MANRTKREPKIVENEQPEPTNECDGKTIKTEQASAAIAAITANIASTSISIPDIDNDPIINAEEDRTPEEPSALVSSKIMRKHQK